MAPYASALALMVAPEAACLNLQRLAADGLAGRLGLFEAVDYTPSRLRRGQSSAVVRSFMAHHQAMSLLSCAYVLLARPMQKRFESDPLFQATLLLLQERIPRPTPSLFAADRTFRSRAAAGGPELPVRVLATPNTAIPEVQLLSNGRYHVMVTNAGGGSSRWKDLAVTRWSEDSTSDNWGSFCYLRDVASGEFWSTAHQPTLKQADTLRSDLLGGAGGISTQRSRFRDPYRDRGFARGRYRGPSCPHHQPVPESPRPIDVTSYAEVVLAPAGRRRVASGVQQSFRANGDHPRTAGNSLHPSPTLHRRAGPVDVSSDDRAWQPTPLTISFETDRMRFIGRGGSVAAPRAMTDSGALSGTEGPVLDPIAAIRHRMIIDAGATMTIDMVSGAGETRDAVLHLVDKYQDRRLADRVVRADMDAQPGRASAAQRGRGGFAALCTPRRLGDLRQRVVAGSREYSGPKPSRAIWPMGLRDLR